MNPIFLVISGTGTFLAGMVLEHAFHFTGSSLAALVLFGISYLLVGTRVLIRMGRNILKGEIFDENFLMGIATLGAIAIGEYSGAAAVMVFYNLGEYLQDRAVDKSRRNISALLDIRPDYANLDREGQIHKVDPHQVQVGDTILVQPGEKIPLDGLVIQGEAMLNLAALTGESVPRRARVDDTVLSGSVNLDGVLHIQVSKTFGESTASKIIELVENAASRKAKVETFITKYARYYTPTVMALALLIAVAPPLFTGASWSDWIYRSLVLLIISCPCALVMSIPLGFFGGIGAASKKGVLIKGSNYLEALAGLDTVVFDKTGTLTMGVFKVSAIEPDPQSGLNQEELLEAAALAEVYSRHPIAASIREAYGEDISLEGLGGYIEMAGLGVQVQAQGRCILAGNAKLMEREGIGIPPETGGGTQVHVAVNGRYMGSISISDQVKADSARTIRDLKALGLRRTVMLSGDRPEVAEDLARELGIAEVKGGLLPQDKVDLVEIYRGQKHRSRALAFVGDGINDAPVLALSDVGIAMGALGSDAAIEAADVVLMTDEPSKLVEAVKVARFTKKIVWQNIIFALGVQGVFLVLGSMGVASIWEAIFADVGVSLLAVLNTWRILRI
ncbi:MAG: heavy metal translocating P-type ATPase [Treponema sp.]|nr:heavy metal translocating P-type ATPase [Treponema sp.]